MNDTNLFLWRQQINKSKFLSFFAVSILVICLLAALSLRVSATISYGTMQSQVMADPNVVIRGTSAADNAQAAEMVAAATTKTDAWWKSDASIEISSTTYQKDYYIIYPDATSATADGVTQGQSTNVTYGGVTKSATVMIGASFGVAPLNTIVPLGVTNSNTTIFFKAGTYTMPPHQISSKYNMAFIGLEEGVSFIAQARSGNNESISANGVTNTLFQNITFEGQGKRMAPQENSSGYYFLRNNSAQNVVFDNCTLQNIAAGLGSNTRAAMNILGADGIIFNDFTIKNVAVLFTYSPIQVNNGSQSIYFNNLSLDKVTGGSNFIKIENGSTYPEKTPYTSVFFTNTLTYANMTEAQKAIYIESYIYATLAFPSGNYRYAQLRNRNGSWIVNYILLAATMPSTNSQYAIFDLADNTFVIKKNDVQSETTQIQTVIDTVAFIRYIKGITAAEAYNIKYEVGSDLGTLSVPEIKVSSQFQMDTNDYTGYWENIEFNIIPVRDRDNIITTPEVYIFDPDTSQINLPANENRYRIFNIDFATRGGYTLHEVIEGITPLALETDPYTSYYGNSNNLTYAEYDNAAAKIVENATINTFQSSLFTSLVHKIAIDFENSIDPSPIYAGETLTLTANFTDDNENSFTHGAILNNAVNKNKADDNTPTVKWFSTNTNVATVQENTGVVTTLTSGTAIIVAKAVDSYNDGEIEKPWATFTLTVQANYDIDYVLNGGDNAIANPRSYNEKNTFPIVITAPTKTGYNFNGWTVEYENTSIPNITTPTPDYAIAANTTGNITLTAHWTAKDYKVHYVLDGGKYQNTALLNDRIVHWNDDNLLPGATSYDASAMARPYWTFTGWDVVSGGTGTNVDNAASYGDLAWDEEEMCIVLQAQWVKNPQYTVSYANGGGTGALPSSSSYFAGDTVTVRNCELTNLHKTFGGWTPDGGTTIYLPGMIFTMGTAAVELTAIWNPDSTYTVVYNSNGGTGTLTDSSSPYYAGTTVTALAHKGAFTKQNYILAAWNTRPDGTGTAYTADGTTTFTMPQNNIVLYAQWQPGENTVTYAAANATLSGTTEKVLTGKSPQNIPTVTVDSGYIFENQWAASTGGVFTTTELSGYIVKGDVTFTAVITKKKESELPEVSDKIEETLETKDHIKYIYGYPDGTVHPDGDITRAEVAAIFFRLIKDKNKNNVIESQFSDIASGQWYAQAINYLASKDILFGYEDDTFKPNQSITRAEFAAIASRFDDLSSTIDNPFVDVKASYWAYKYIISAYEKGWISGYPGGKFKPENPITRAEVVTLTNKMLGRGIEKEDIPKELSQLYPDLLPSHWAFAAMIEASVKHEYERKDNGYEKWTEYNFK